MKRWMWTTGLTAVCTLGLGACEDGPTAPGGGMVSGTIYLNPGAGAMVLAIAPAEGIDSVIVGPARGAAGAYFVSPVVGGRVLVHSRTSLATTVRFRVHSAHREEPYELRLVEVADTSGSILSAPGRIDID